MNLNSEFGIMVSCFAGRYLNPIQSDNRRASGDRNSEFRITNSEL